MELFGCCNAAFGFGILVEGCFLVGIFAVAEVLDFYEGFAVNIRQCVLVAVHFFGEVVCNSAVIETGVEECFSGKLQTEIFVQCVILNPFQNFAVLRRIYHDGDVFVVLGSGAYHGGAADINIFNGFSSGDAGFCNGFTERIEVHSHQVDACNAMFLHSLHMVRVVTDGQDAAVNHGMEGLYTAVHHFREAGDFGNRFHRNACCCNGFHGAAGGNDFHSQFMKSLCKFHYPGLIRYTDQGSFNCHSLLPLYRNICP